ncbi:MAG TPA: CocE/NonD family hydrolase [Gemmatimonadales bacterium]|nr:CocE/NonD family hydrolase [Gemmatimonadales bacterium]
MAKTRVLLLLLALSSALRAPVTAQVPGPDTVVVMSGDLKLHALLYRPEGPGPFPAVLFNHGSGHAAGRDSSGRVDQRHPELLGPLFVKHGYLFLYLFRRGDGLSRGQGVPSADRMDSAAAAGGQVARNDLQLRLIEGDELNDVLAGLACLRARRDVQAGRLAVVGVSFGGSLTLLVAEPLFFIHAANDYSVAPAQALGSEMTRLGKSNRVKIYPAVGNTPEEGHDFIDLGVRTWEADVFGFLDEHVRQ